MRFNLYLSLLIVCVLLTNKVYSAKTKKRSEKKNEKLQMFDDDEQYVLDSAGNMSNSKEVSPQDIVIEREIDLIKNAERVEVIQNVTTTSKPSVVPLTGGSTQPYERICEKSCIWNVYAKTLFWCDDNTLIIEVPRSKDCEKCKNEICGLLGLVGISSCENTGLIEYLGIFKITRCGDVIVQRDTCSYYTKQVVNQNDFLSRDVPEAGCPPDNYIICKLPVCSADPESSLKVHGVMNFDLGTTLLDTDPLSNFTFYSTSPTGLYGFNFNPYNVMDSTTLQTLILEASYSQMGVFWYPCFASTVGRFLLAPAKLKEKYDKDIDLDLLRGIIEITLSYGTWGTFGFYASAPFYDIEVTIEYQDPVSGNWSQYLFGTTKISQFSSTYITLNLSSIRGLRINSRIIKKPTDSDAWFHTNVETVVKYLKLAKASEEPNAEKYYIVPLLTIDSVNYCGPENPLTAFQLPYLPF